MTKMRYYQAKWSWDPKTEAIVSSWCIGKTLNFPCGKSRIGHTRADIDETVRPDVVADLRKPLDYFAPQSFDTVLCDPPFSMYSRFRWIWDLAEIPRRRLILSTPLVNVNLNSKCWRKQFWITTVPEKIMLRVWQIFDRTPSLENYME